MFLNQVLAVAGLASGWMLWWGLAAAIPVLLHYLYRRRQKTIRWAAIGLLMQVVEREARRIRLEQLLLLLLRTLILVVLAIALARPYWRSDDDSQPASGARPPVCWIVAIDVSYSMGYRVDNESRLQVAQQRAMRIVESAQDGDAFALIALGQPPQALVAGPSFDRQAMLGELGRLAPHDAGCDLHRGLQLVADLAQRAVESLPPSTQVRVLLLSDLGSDHWQAVIDGEAAKPFEQLNKAHSVEIESLAEERIANCAVTELRSAAVRTVVGQPLQLEATVRNFGAEAVAQLPVQWVIDGNTVASQRVDIAAGEQQVLQYEHLPTAAGPSVVAVALPADRLPADNSRRQVIEVRQRQEVLFVEQQTGDARLLKLSLAPREPASPDPIDNTLSVFELSASELQNWPVVVLVDLASLDRASLSRLENYVRQGGAVVCLLGPRTLPSVWNESPDGSGLLGFRLLEPAVQDNWSIDPRDYASPIVAPFAGYPDSGLLTTPIFRFWKIQPRQPLPPAWSVDLATQQQDALIVRHGLGAGTVISVLSAPSAAAVDGETWNAMASWPSFVPLMQRLVQVATDTSTAGQTLLAGQPLVGRMPLAAATPPADGSPPTITVTTPDGAEVRLDVGERQAAGGTPWAFLQTQHSGVYWVRSSPASQPQPYAVNVDGSESGLQSLGVDQLPKFAPPLVRVSEAPETLQQGVESSPWLSRLWLLALGGLLICESWLAWLLGRRVG